MSIPTLSHSFSSVANEHHENLILDGTKIGWHLERIKSWERGEKFAPITIDMALTRACNYACHFCYAMLQENDRSRVNTEVMNPGNPDVPEGDPRGADTTNVIPYDKKTLLIHRVGHSAFDKETGKSIVPDSNLKLPFNYFSN